jgi:hypothetical protein
VSSLFEQGDLPLTKRCLVPQDVQAAVASPNLEITVVTARPPIEYVHDLDTMVADEECTGHLFATVARLTLDFHLTTSIIRAFRPA